ncbi:hypothetical protein GCM10025779_15320 [Arthrobacter cryoconiti]
MVTAKIRTDLTIRFASLDAYGNVRPIRKRQRPTPRQQLPYSTNLLLRGYDTATRPFGKIKYAPYLD